MKIVIAPNALKGSLTASDAAHAMAEGARRASPSHDVVLCPIADGGDGLADVLQYALAAETVTQRVVGPIDDEVEAAWLYMPATQTAVIEMASASGIAIVPMSRRDAMRATTIGTGQLISAALQRGAKRIIVGVGGSATTDGGTGMASALGARFTGTGGEEVRPCGGDLSRMRGVDLSGLDERIREVTLEVLCDVDNPLLGPSGAARVYSPQKGATPEQVEELERGLTNLAGIVEKHLGKDIRTLSGGGAAGGLAAGLHAFTGATLRPGAEVVLELTGLRAKMVGANLVMTAEGMLDSQTLQGKAPAAVARLAKEMGIPCLALAGAISHDRERLHEAGFTALFPICNAPMSLDEAMLNARALSADAAEEAVRAFTSGSSSR